MKIRLNLGIPVAKTNSKTTKNLLESSRNRVQRKLYLEDPTPARRGKTEVYRGDPTGNQTLEYHIYIKLDLKYRNPTTDN